MLDRMALDNPVAHYALLAPTRRLQVQPIAQHALLELHHPQLVQTVVQNVFNAQPDTFHLPTVRRAPSAPLDTIHPQPALRRARPARPAPTTSLRLLAQQGPLFVPSRKGKC